MRDTGSKSVFRTLVLGVICLQPVQPASINGRALAHDDVGLAGATVQLRNDAGVDRVSTTKGDGSFKVDDLDAGTYSISVVSSGFRAMHIRDVEIHPNEDLIVPSFMVSVAMCPEAGPGSLRLFLNSNGRLKMSGQVIRALKHGDVAAVAGASITLICGAARECGRTTSDNTGTFSFALPAAQSFDLKIERGGFEPFKTHLISPQRDWDNVYGPFELEHCPMGLCGTTVFQKRPRVICE